MKIGICGTGDISHLFMKSANELKLEVKAVYHREKIKAQRFAEEYLIQFYFDNLNDFLLSDFDTVYVGLPNQLHYETAKKCILLNKNVLLEKPVTLRLKEFEELIQLAQQHHVFLLEVDRVEHLPAYQIIKEKIQKIDMIQIDYCKRSRRYDDYLNGNLPHIFDRECGGGALYDLGVYALHFVIGILDIPIEYNYTALIGRGNVDMAGILVMKYKNCIVNVSLSKISHGESRVLIHGNEVQIKSNSAPSLLRGINIINKDGTNYYDTKDNNFTCFLKKAVLIINNNDIEEYHRLTQKSIKVIEIIDNIINK